MRDNSDSQVLCIEGEVFKQEIGRQFSIGTLLGMEQLPRQILQFSWS